MLPTLLIQNKPLSHYILSIFSLLIQGEKKIRLKAHGRAIGRTIDMINLLNERIIPGILDIRLINGAKDSKSEDKITGKKIRLSELTADLTYIEKIENSSNKFNLEEALQEDSLIDLCKLELIMSSKIFRDNVSKIKISSRYEEGKNEGQLFSIGELNLKSDKFFLDGSFLRGENMIKNNEGISKMGDALLRSGLAKPDLSSLGEELSKMDDVIIGIDTNILYSCLVTTNLLSCYNGKPSKDFLDTPNWVTLVFSKVGLWEIENMANSAAEKNIFSYKNRFALRALQELMLIHRSADLEGVSIFLTGRIPPEFGIAERTKRNIILDSELRYQFKEFLKNIDFHKGAFFITQDRNCAVLGEAEGLKSILIEKPREEEVMSLYSEEEKINVSELIYELSVSFNPLQIDCFSDNGEKTFTFFVKSAWIGKDLKDWEEWKMQVYDEDKNNQFRKELIEWFDKNDLDENFIGGWERLSERELGR